MKTFKTDCFAVHTPEDGKAECRAFGPGIYMAGYRNTRKSCGCHQFCKDSGIPPAS